MFYLKRYQILKLLTPRESNGYIRNIFNKFVILNKRNNLILRTLHLYYLKASRMEKGLLDDNYYYYIIRSIVFMNYPEN